MTTSPPGPALRYRSLWSVLRRRLDVLGAVAMTALAVSVFVFGDPRAAWWCSLACVALWLLVLAGLLPMPARVVAFGVVPIHPFGSSDCRPVTFDAGDGWWYFDTACDG